MNYEDSSSDDVPYLPPDQFQEYEQHQHQSQKDGTYSNLPSEKRKGRSQFTEDEIKKLDAQDDRLANANPTASSSVPKPLPPPPTDIAIADSNFHDPTTASTSTNVPPPPQPPHYPLGYSRFSSQNEFQPESPERPFYSKISWGRRALGILFITIPAALFGVAAHFIDWPMYEFQLFSASFFIFQGVLWPSFGIMIVDQFCTSKNIISTEVSAPKGTNSLQVLKVETRKWILVICVFIHGVLSASAIIFQLLSIQRLNITVSLALSFGFDVVVILIRYISERRKCSFELIILAVLSYCGFAVVGIPAFISQYSSTRKDYAIGVAASVGVMLCSVPASLSLAYLRRKSVSDSILGSSFAFFGCILSLITKEIMGSSISDLSVDGRSFAWIAGLISVVFLGTIFLFLESRLSGLIWQRDDDKPKEFSSITRTRLAVFIISCLWELSRQGFRKTSPDPYEILGGLLVVLGCFLASGYEAWSQSQTFHDENGTGVSSKSKFCAFIPWLFTRKSHPTGK